MLSPNADRAAIIAELNATVLAPRAEGQRVWVVGDSNVALESFTPKLRTLLKPASYTVRGLGGATLSTHANGAGASSGVMFNYIVQAVNNDFGGVPPDLVIASNFINDFGKEIPLGTIADTDQAVSFYGALDYLCANVAGAGQPRSRLVLCTPHGNLAGFVTGNYLTPNANGATLQQFREAIVEVGRKYGIEVLRAGEEAQVGGVYGVDTLVDPVHFNALGAQRWANYIADRI